MFAKKEGFIPNPVLSGLIGICPLAAAAKSLAEGFAYGLGTFFCSIVLALLLPPLRNLLPERLHAPTALSLSAAMALIFGFGLQLYSPALAQALWIYIPLLAVSGLSLVSIRQSVKAEIDGRSSAGILATQAAFFFLTSTCIGAIREAVGIGIITLPTPGISLYRMLLSDFAPLSLLVTPAGGFMVLGFLLALYRILLRAGGRSVA